MAGRAGESGAEMTEWQSGSSVVCRRLAGMLSSMVVVATAALGAGSRSEAASYSRAAVSSVTGGNGGTTGGDRMTLAGEELGASR